MPCNVLKTPSPNCVDTYPNTDKSLLFKRPVIGAAKSGEYVRLESESLASFSSSFSTRTSSSSLIHLTPSSPCFQRTTAPLQDASYLAFTIFRRLPLFGPLHPILAPSYGKHRQQQCLCSHRYRHDLPYDGPEACFHLCRQNLCQRCRCQGGSEVAPGELFFFNPRCWRADEPVTQSAHNFIIFIRTRMSLSIPPPLVRLPRALTPRLPAMSPLMLIARLLLLALSTIKSFTKLSWRKSIRTSECIIPKITGYFSNSHQVLSLLQQHQSACCQVPGCSHCKHQGRGRCLVCE